LTRYLASFALTFKDGASRLYITFRMVQIINLLDPAESVNYIIFICYHDFRRLSGTANHFFKLQLFITIFY
jgi:hypothetical protein